MKKIIFVLSISFAALFIILFQKTAVQHKDVASTSESNTIVYLISSSYQYDVTDITKLYKNVDLVLVGSVSEKFPAQKKETYSIALTPGKLVVDTIIKGKLKNKNVNFFVEGGTITLSEYEKSLINISPEILKKEGIDILDKRTKDNIYIKFVPENSINFDNGQRYVVFLNRIGNTDDYAVVGNYGMIPVDNFKKISELNDILSLPKSIIEK